MIKVQLKSVTIQWPIVMKMRLSINFYAKLVESD